MRFRHFHRSPERSHDYDLARDENTIDFPEWGYASWLLELISQSQGHHWKGIDRKRCLTEVSYVNHDHVATRELKKNHECIWTVFGLVSLCNQHNPSQWFYCQMSFIAGSNDAISSIKMWRKPCTNVALRVPMWPLAKWKQYIQSLLWPYHFLFF